MKKETLGMDEPRELARVPEDGGTGGKTTTDAEWLEAGTEDPAFFIKPADED